MRSSRSISGSAGKPFIQLTASTDDAIDDLFSTLLFGANEDISEVFHDVTHSEVVIPFLWAAKVPESNVASEFASALVDERVLCDGSSWTKHVVRRLEAEIVIRSARSFVVVDPKGLSIQPVYIDSFRDGFTLNLGGTDPDHAVLRIVADTLDVVGNVFARPRGEVTVTRRYDPNGRWLGTGFSEYA
jgi:hypothetical protein